MQPQLPQKSSCLRGGALAGRGGHTGSAAALESVQGAICLHGSVHVLLLMMPQVGEKSLDTAKSFHRLESAQFGGV